MRKILLFGAILLSQQLTWGQAFGPDVIIKPDTVNQQNVEITTAFNGWMFSAISRNDETANMGGITVRKSIDGGYTWTTIDEYFVSDVRYPTHDIVVTGTDEASLKLFLVGVNHNVTSNNYVIFVDVYNGQTGTFTTSSYNFPKGTNRVNDVEIASDYKFPAVGAAPFSVALLYSTYGASSDSIISVVSVDGGATFPIRNTVGTTLGYTRSVSLDYGRSLSASNGRYFAAWEQLSAFNDRNGHIYTSRNTSMVNSPWIAPINLDSVSSTMINLCRNPRIAVQQNNNDNDSASVTALVTVDRDYVGDGSDYDALGFYNKLAHYTNHWYRFDISNSGMSDMGADVVYEESDQLFHAVYFDSTEHQLKYVTNAMQFTAPNAWTTVESGMNDVPLATVTPNARIAFRPGNNEVALAWIDNAGAGDGLAKFDIESFISASLDELTGAIQITLYPNPATSLLNVETSLQTSTVRIIGMDGTIVFDEKENGSKYSISVEDLAPGMYILQVEQNGAVEQQQFVKQ